MVETPLARKDVADVALDPRHRDRRDRVADGDRGVSIRARVDDDAGGLFGGGLVDQVHDLALVVRLAEFDRELMAPRRSEERRVGKEGGSRGGTGPDKKTSVRRE